MVTNLAARGSIFGGWPGSSLFFPGVVLVCVVGGVWVGFGWWLGFGVLSRVCVCVWGLVGVGVFVEDLQVVSGWVLVGMILLHLSILSVLDFCQVGVWFFWENPCSR